MRKLSRLIPGEHALVVGGSSGIGLALAREFVRKGACVHIAARRQNLLGSALAQLQRESPHPEAPHTAHSCDVTKDEDVARLFAELSALGGSPIIVVNAAGMTIPGLFVDAPGEDLERMMDANFMGTVRIVRAAVPHMIAQRRGYILNVSSLASLITCFGMTGYCASKFAVRGFTETLRAELKLDGIEVSLLCPPDTDTPMLAAEIPLRSLETDALSGSAQLLTAEQVAKAAIAGMEKGRATIVPGGTARLTALAQRLAPGLIEKLSHRIVQKARAKKS